MTLKATEHPGILLIEADLAVRHPLAEYLRECGYKVVEAGNTDDAITLLSATEITIDISIVLCDVNGPGNVDGFGLSRWVHANRPKTRIVLAGTLKKATDKAGEICEDGPALAKPYHHQFLLDRLKQEIARRDAAQDRDG